jgi:hypothetical protein
MDGFPKNAYWLLVSCTSHPLSLFTGAEQKSVVNAVEKKLRGLDSTKFPSTMVHWDLYAGGQRGSQKRRAGTFWGFGRRFCKNILLWSVFPKDRFPALSGVARHGTFSATSLQRRAMGIRNYSSATMELLIVALGSLANQFELRNMSPRYSPGHRS